MTTPQFKERIGQIFSALDQYTYYELLNLENDASPDDIRAAFHRMAQNVHPDQFQQHPDEGLKTQIYAIYKRMTEGYRVLMDPQDRKTYDAGLEEGKRRFIRTVRKVSGPKRIEDAVEHPGAKRFFILGLDAQRRGDLKTAKMNFQFALKVAEDHPAIKEQLAKVEEEIERKAGE